MKEMLCPNCGQRLADYRVERQAAGPREVVLHWAICTHCRHVALRRWSFTDPGAADESYAMVGMTDSDGQLAPLGRSERVS